MFSIRHLGTVARTRGSLFTQVASASSNNNNNNNKGRSPASEDEDQDDPSVVLRQLQAEMRERTMHAGVKMPPAPPRRSGKTQFFQQPSSSSSSPSGSAGEAADSRAPAAPKKTADNLFLKKLYNMEEEAKQPSFPTYDATAEKRRKNIEQKIKDERKKLVVFRDVGMDLDKPILSRDVLLIFKYFRYGIEFAVDNELERMLRYFNEHAVNELKIIQGSKLMRGPPTLSKKHAGSSAASAIPHVGGVGVAGTGSSGPTAPASPSIRSKDGYPPPLADGDGEGFSLSSTFPAVRCVPLQRLCRAPSDDTAAIVRSAFQPPSTSQSGFAASSGSSAGEHKPATYHHRSDALFTTLSAATFRRPAVIIYSQLGQKYGSQADSEWRHLAYESICPALLRHVPGAVAPEKEPAAVHRHGGLRGGAAATTAGTAAGAGAGGGRRPIDIVSLRSVDLYKYKWVHRLYINRFAASLAPQTQPHDAVLAGTTYVGTQLLAPFYPVLGVRNYLLPHVLLVDHDGVVRWMSGGCPDAMERAVFPSLLRQLEMEYYKSKNFSGRP